MPDSTVGERVAKSLGDYVQVKDRIARFYELFGGGRLVTDRVEIWQDDGTPRVVVKALAYRTVDDPHPGVGWSWMELPGRTPYTKGSEVENAETSAWGRAIGSLGILIDTSIATQNEIDNKGDGHDDGPPNRPELERLAENLVGTVEAGKPPVDMQLRQTPDGAAWGFKLKAGRAAYQCLALGPLADALSLLPDLTDQQVRVWGRIEMVPWEKAGKPMPPFARIAMTRIQTDDWTLPAPIEAESAPLFQDDDLAGMPADWQA